MRADGAIATRLKGELWFGGEAGSVARLYAARFRRTSSPYARLRRFSTLPNELPHPRGRPMELRPALVVLFWGSLATILYAYLGYPLLLGLLSRWFGRSRSAPALDET